MTAKKLAAWTLCMAAMPVLALAQAPQVDATAVLTEAHYFKETSKLLEGAAQWLDGEPTPEQIQKIRDALTKQCAALEGKNADLKTLLEQLQAKLEPLDLPAARDAVHSALDQTYSSLAQKYQVVGEGSRDEWLRYTGWLELAWIRFKQDDVMAAKDALWKASSALAAVKNADAEVLKIFKDLAQKVGRSLMEQGKFEAAGDHFSKILLNSQIQLDEQESAKTEQLQATALGLACFESGDLECAASHLKDPAVLQSAGVVIKARAQHLLESAKDDPTLYPKVFELAAAWRKVKPDGEELLKVVASTLTSRGEGARLTEWSKQTSDCAIKSYLVEVSQRASGEEPFLDLAQAAVACDAQDPRAQAALAKANYRMAVQLWNGEVVRDHPKDFATAKRSIEKIKKHLEEAGEAQPGAVELRQKVDDYAANWSKSQASTAKAVAGHKDADLKGQCMHLYERALWAEEMLNIIPISDFGSIVTDLQRDREKCTSHLEESQNKELDTWLASLKSALPTRCGDESRRSRLPLNMDATTKEEIEQLHAKIQAILKFCNSISETETERLSTTLTALKREIEKRS